MRSILAPLVIALAVAGCASAPPAVTADSLAGTVWMETCGEGDAPDQRADEAWLRFDPDGLFAYSFDDPSGPDAEWEKDGTDSWRLDGTTLTVSWTDGFAVTTYDLAGVRPDDPATRVEGTTTRGCERGATIEPSF